MKNNKNAKRIASLLLGLVLLTGCTKTLTGEDNKVVKNEETGKALTENILCRPTDETSIKLYEEPTPTEGLKVGDKVKIIGYGNASSHGDRGRAGGIGWTRTILAIHKGKRYPYQVGSSGITTGFYKAEALKKI